MTCHCRVSAIERRYSGQRLGFFEPHRIQCMTTQETKRFQTTILVHHNVTSVKKLKCVGDGEPPELPLPHGPPWGRLPTKMTALTPSFLLPSDQAVLIARLRRPSMGSCRTGRGGEGRGVGFRRGVWEAGGGSWTTTVLMCDVTAHPF